jgi:hypothetical protein
VGVDIEKVPLIENKKDNKTKKVNEDFTVAIKNILDEIFDKFDVNRRGYLTLQELYLFFKHAYSQEIDMQSIKNLFNLPSCEKEEINLKSFRNYFYTLIKSQKEKEVYNILKQYGYSTVINHDCRNFFLSFNTNENLEVKVSDAINNKFNCMAFELYIKHVGTVLNIDHNKHINLIYDQTQDSCNIILMLENKLENEKKVTLQIESNGYMSFNGFTYKTLLKSKELRYLFPIAIDRSKTNNMSNESIMIKYHIICE